jgi:hypothetical protein
MARRRPAARWIVGTGALVVAGFFAAFALTSALSGDEDEESAAEDAPTGAQTPGPGASGTVGVEVSVPTSDDEPRTAETVDPIKDTVRAPCPSRISGFSSTTRRRRSPSSRETAAG